MKMIAIIVPKKEANVEQLVEHFKEVPSHSTRFIIVERDSNGNE